MVSGFQYRAGISAFLRPHRGEFMQDSGCGLRRTLLLDSRVNKGKKKDRSYEAPVRLMLTAATR